MFFQRTLVIATLAVFTVSSYAAPSPISSDSALDARGKKDSSIPSIETGGAESAGLGKILKNIVKALEDVADGDEKKAKATLKKTKLLIKAYSSNGGGGDSGDTKPTATDPVGGPEATGVEPATAVEPEATDVAPATDAADPTTTAKETKATDAVE